MATVLHIRAGASSWWSNANGTWTRLSEPVGRRVWVVTDLADETFAEIAVPRIFGSDRSNFVARQIASRFPESLFRVALAAPGGGSLMDRLAPPSITLNAVEQTDVLEEGLKAVQTDLVGVWSTSMLLVLLGQKNKLPTTVFIVLIEATAMRVVFVKNNAPALTRLVSVQSNPAEQATEILRTVRHLENTRVIERGTQRFGVMLLGAAPALATVLRADRLDALPELGMGPEGPPADWRFALYDLVCKTPAGQLAPLSYRSGYMASQVRKAAWVGIALCLAGAAWVASGSMTAFLNDRAERDQLQSAMGTLGKQMAEIDAALDVYGVTPEVLRNTLALDHTEIATAPDLRADLTRIATAIGGANGARLKSLQWQLMAASEPACAKDNVVAAPVEPIEGAPPAPVPTRKVEMQMTVAVALGVGPRLRLQQATDISQRLGALAGVTVLQDAAKRLRSGELTTGAAQSDTDRELSWCAVFADTANTRPVKGASVP